MAFVEGAVIVLLLMFNGFLAMSEVAIVFRAAAGSNSWWTPAVSMPAPHWHLRNPSRYLAAIQMGMTLIGCGRSLRRLDLPPELELFQDAARRALGPVIPE